MAEPEFDAAFADLISRPWPRSQNSWDRDLQPAAMTHVFPDFGPSRAPDALEIARGMNEVLVALSGYLAEAPAWCVDMNTPSI